MKNIKRNQVKITVVSKSEKNENTANVMFVGMEVMAANKSSVTDYWLDRLGKSLGNYFYRLYTRAI